MEVYFAVLAVIRMFAVAAKPARPVQYQTQSLRVIVLTAFLFRRTSIQNCELERARRNCTRLKLRSGSMTIEATFSRAGWMAGINCKYVSEECLQPRYFQSGQNGEKHAGDGGVSFGRPQFF